MDGEVDLIFNTPHGLSPDGRPRFDGYEIRSAAVSRNLPCVTTVQGLSAAVQGIEAMLAGEIGVRSLQSWRTDAGTAEPESGSLTGAAVTMMSRVCAVETASLPRADHRIPAHAASGAVPAATAATPSGCTRKLWPSWKF